MLKDEIRRHESVHLVMTGHGTQEVVCLAFGLWMLLPWFFVPKKLHAQPPLIFVLVGVLALQFLRFSFLSSPMDRLRYQRS